MSHNEKYTKLAQKLGQPQPFILAVFLLDAWANLDILGQPNIFLAHRQVDALGLRPGVEYAFSFSVERGSKGQVCHSVPMSTER